MNKILACDCGHLLTLQLGITQSHWFWTFIYLHRDPHRVVDLVPHRDPHRVLALALHRDPRRVVDHMVA